jgi:hypothetical protein
MNAVPIDAALASAGSASAALEGGPHAVDPIALLGGASATLGLAGLGVAIYAWQEAASLPRDGSQASDWIVIHGRALMILIDLLMVAGGCAIALLGVGGLAA